MWEKFIHALYPLPVLLLGLMFLPIPSKVKPAYRRVVLGITDFVLFYNPLSSYVTLFTISTTLSLLAFAATALKTYDMSRGTETHEKRCSRWRAERNFWMCLLSVVLWLCLHKIRTLTRECEDLRTKNK